MQGHVSPRPVVVAALALLPAACSAVTALPDPPGAPRPVAVAVIDREWHTEIGLPASELSGPLAVLRDRFPGATMLSFGFGDRHYLAARDPGSADTLLAAFPGPGALLVTGLAASPEAAFGAADVVELRLTEAGARRAAAWLWDSFAHLPTGLPVPLGDGPYPGSLFFAARITYSLAHTCNTWTAEVLQEGGAPVTAAGVVLAGQVMERARAAAGR